LAILEGRLKEALTYFGQVVEVINEPHLASMVNQAQDLVLKQRDLTEQQEFHRIASREIEHALDESAQRLDQLLNSVPENSDGLLGTYGWSRIPLVFKLPTTKAALQPGESSPVRELKQGLVKVLEIIRQFSGPKDQESSVFGGMDKITAAVSDSHILNFPSLSGILGSGSPPAEIGSPSSTIASTNAQVKRFGPNMYSRLERPAQNPTRSFLRTNKSLELRSRPVMLSAYFLGNFVIYLNDESVAEWPGSRSLAMLKYLLIHRDRNIPREVLMETFWPEALPEASRNSLNVAIHGLRKSLRTFTEIPVVVFDEGAYRFSQEVSIWVDAEEFKRHFQSGRQLESVGRLSAAIQEYETAISLYKGEFLADDPYEEWTISMREHLRLAYLDTSDHLSHIYFAKRQYTACANLCQIILELDDCSEAAHRLLMRCYSRQGQHNLALRQYRICEERLRAELNIEPAEETIQLFERIRRREKV
jgi:DNA-binding SARP family transcriptional activator